MGRAEHPKRIQQFQNQNPNRDHPNVYFGKWKHNLAVVFDDDFANDCLGAILKKRDYHSDNYQFSAAENLRADTTVPAFEKLLERIADERGGWCRSELYVQYGNAHSTPQSFEAGGGNDICGSTVCVGGLWTCLDETA
ncbi:uncharacterized protein L3040_001280 [Drepanopeziza brunnea f. sp. 'multigermtubi']|uniref:uncharacterized protein n=1 Tax=Drepanopeziza brunnea f. sp. 'multigermtubi' TaxID=698441 RepID=UPI002396D1A0|nr:hypothetical protein L3040_001280 [Drepanopeziza brunnea f. sp. 'multigermtubi']